MLASNFIKTCLMVFVFCLVSNINVYSADTVLDGNQLLEQCLKAERFLDADGSFTGNEMSINYDAFLVGRCLGLVRGVEYTMKGLNSKLPKNWQTCFPKVGLTGEQLTRIVVKYLKNNPKNLHLPDSLLVWMAFREAYPCP